MMTTALDDEDWLVSNRVGSACYLSRSQGNQHENEPDTKEDEMKCAE